MKKDWLDEQLRRNYPSEAQDFDTEAAWRQLQERRRRQQRKPAPILLWTLLAGLILASGGSAIWFAWAYRGETQTPTRTSSQPLIVQIPDYAKTPAAKSYGYRDMASVELTAEQARAGEQGAEPERGTMPALHAHSPVLQTTGLMTAEQARAGEQGAGPEHNPMPATHSPLQQLSIEETPPQTQRRNRKWRHFLNAQYGFATRQRAGSDPDYLNSLESQDRALDLQQIGLELRYNLSERLFIQTGLSFTSWTDKRERFLTEYYTVRDDNYLLQQIIRSDGTTENIFGPADIPYTRTTIEQAYNRYMAIETPILAGYSQPVGAQGRIDLSAGLSASLIGMRLGRISEPNGQQTDLNDAPYRDFGDIDALVQARWLYRLPGRGLEVGAGISGRASARSRTTSQALFSEKRQALSASLILGF